MLVSPLNEEELASLLEEEAFASLSSPLTLWQKGWVVLCLLMLVASVLMISRTWRNTPTLTEAPLVEWTEGKAEVLDRPDWLACLQTWGRDRGLPAADRILFQSFDSQVSLVWIQNGQVANYTLSQPLSTMCHR